MHIPLPLFEYLSVGWFPSLIISIYSIVKNKSLPKYLQAISVIVIFFAIEKLIVGWSEDGIPYYINLMSVKILDFFSLILPLLIIVINKKFHFPLYINALAILGLIASLFGFVASFLFLSLV